MILKNYQKLVIKDLMKYLDALDENSAAGAYNKIWLDKGIKVGHYKEILPYQDLLSGVPSVCVKVPTGGGKTFIACNAVKPIFDKLSFFNKVVVWLVPSDAILTQTLAALRNPDHAYRQQLNMDFNHRVEVYTKEELLNGQNFNSSIIEDQLSVMVLSYDSFRGRGKEFLKSKQENPNFASFSDDGSDISLIETINRLNPVVIVDESHHAKSPLSVEMLQNFNPRFVLELTATPRKGSNIISFVDAAALKKENMVKLPVIVYNHSKTEKVISTTIELRNNLENLAKIERQNGGKYIRPIVLFQAQPKTSDDSETFEKIRERLIKDYKIPEEQIAIKTAQIDELKKYKNLLSEDCPIRYIITINALGEGWDCPFAYILASLANKSSVVDVEQILGRILRLPNTRHNDNKLLNMSYVFTSSAHFQTTLEHIVKVLNGEGFSKRDCLPITKTELIAPELELAPPENVSDEEDDFDDDTVTVDKFTETALAQCEEYEENLPEENNSHLPEAVASQMKNYTIKPEFVRDVENIKIPQFFRETKSGLFDNINLLDEEDLRVDFDLSNESSKINFEGIYDEIYKIDAGEDGAIKSKLSREMQIYIKEHCTTEEARINFSKDTIIEQLDRKFDGITTSKLKKFVNRIIENMDAENKTNLQKFPLSYADLIESKIKDLLKKYTEKKFYADLLKGNIKCEATYKMKPIINPADAITSIERSLYTGEGSMNELEQKFILNLTTLDNIKWWHRNLSRSGFCINGFINHYPDFMIMTTNGKMIIAETKGKHLNNEDTAQKAKLGHTWASSAGSGYDYYMIFDDFNISDLSNGITNINEFMGIVRNL